MKEDELHAWCENNGGHEISFYGYSYGLVLYDKTFVDGRICNKCGWHEERATVSKGINLAVLAPPLIFY